MTRTDSEIIDVCLQGRTEAFGVLVARHQDRLYNTLVKVLGSADAAQEATQTAFVQAFHRLTTFQGESAFYSWLFRIAVNVAITEKRKQRQMVASVENVQAKTGQEPVDQRRDNHPSHAMEVEESQRLIRQALSELPSDHRTMLILKEIEGLSYEEIAQACQCPIGTVRSRLHRARQELKEKLKLVMPSL
ncbi:MAG: sigma-70 family RNA polymerase sigma factor [Planctomycetota bacterium]|nr:sigma-70 family RNA polymerase sigma factor [Planctomycetota bacterium]MDA1213748.1 sigma-70 family RNA polymerase sigma factor [Planctomycetota bacterium]